MFWVYESVRGQLFSLKDFNAKPEAIKYADLMFEKAKTRGSTSVFVVHQGHDLIYSTGSPRLPTPESS
jgi:hypothetical protein